MANQHSATYCNFRYPSPVYHQSFFVVRLVVTVDRQPLSIKGPDTRPLFCHDSKTIEVSRVTCKASRALNKAEIDCTKTFFDQHSPLLAVTFSSKDMHQHMSSFICDSITLSECMRKEIEPLLVSSLQIVPPQLDIALELYLCSPSRDTTTPSKLYRIDSTSNVRFYIDLMEQSKLFGFQQLMEHVVVGADQSSSCITPRKENPTISPGSQKMDTVIIEVPHVPKWSDLFYELSRAAEHWFSIGVYLEIPQFRLMMWRTQWDDYPMKCVQDMLYWLDRNRRPPVTWEQVITALLKVGRCQQARQLCSKYGVHVPFELIHTSEVQEDTFTQQKAASNKVSALYEHIDNVNSLCDDASPALITEVNDLKIQMIEFRRQLESAQKDEDSFSSNKASIVELKTKLASSEQDYLEARKRLRRLMEELAQKTSELEEKSSSLKELKERDLREESVVQAKMRWQRDQQQLELVRNCSQENYIHEIEDQIEREENKLSDLMERNNRLKRKLPVKEARIAGLADKIEEKAQARENILCWAACKTRASTFIEDSNYCGDGQEEELLELQTEITKDNIKLVKVRLEYAEEKLKLESIEYELERRQESLKAKKNLLPNLKKTRIEGLDLPVHRAKLGYALDFKVSLLDNESKPCKGNHVVTLCDASRPLSESYKGKPDEAGCGTYTLTYTPKEPRQHLLNVHVNGEPLLIQPLIVLAKPISGDLSNSHDRVTEETLVNYLAHNANCISSCSCHYKVPRLFSPHSCISVNKSSGPLHTLSGSSNNYVNTSSPDHEYNSLHYPGLSENSDPYGLPKALNGTGFRGGYANVPVYSVLNQLSDISGNSGFDSPCSNQDEIEQGAYNALQHNLHGQYPRGFNAGADSSNMYSVAYPEVRSPHCDEPALPLPVASNPVYSMSALTHAAVDKSIDVPVYGHPNDGIQDEERAHNSLHYDTHCELDFLNGPTSSTNEFLPLNPTYCYQPFRCSKVYSHYTSSHTTSHQLKDHDSGFVTSSGSFPSTKLTGPPVHLDKHPSVRQKDSHAIRRSSYHSIGSSNGSVARSEDLSSNASSSSTQKSHSLFSQENCGFGTELTTKHIQNKQQDHISGSIWGFTSPSYIGPPVHLDKHPSMRHRDLHLARQSSKDNEAQENCDAEAMTWQRTNEFSAQSEDRISHVADSPRKSPKLEGPPVRLDRHPSIRKKREALNKSAMRSRQWSSHAFPNISGHSNGPPQIYSDCSHPSGSALPTSSPIYTLCHSDTSISQQVTALNPVYGPHKQLEGQLNDSYSFASSKLVGPPVRLDKHPLICHSEQHANSWQVGRDSASTCNSVTKRRNGLLHPPFKSFGHSIPDSDHLGQDHDKYPQELQRKHSAVPIYESLANL